MGKGSIESTEYVHFVNFYTYKTNQNSMNIGASQVHVGGSKVIALYIEIIRYLKAIIYHIAMLETKCL